MEAGSDAKLIWRRPGKPRAQAEWVFLPLMRTAVAAHPNNSDLLLDLVVALGQAERWHEIVDRLAPLAAEGLAAELAVELGVAADRCGDPLLARRALEMAIADAGDRGLRNPVGGIAARLRARVELSSLLAASGAQDAALGIVMDILHREPSDEAALSRAADLLLRQGRAAEVIALLDDLERRGAGSTLQLSCRANALGALGAHEKLRQLISPARWCVEAMIAPGLVDNRRLAEVILSHEAIRKSPAGRATQGSNQRLDGFASRDEPECRALVSEIRRHVDTYVAARGGQAHPLMSQMPKAAVLQGWALVTKGDGNEARHIHPASWITAVYYVRLPPMKRGVTGPPPGSIVFGPWPAKEYSCDSDFPAWHIEPREGMLLIFPSFLAHGTMPSETDELRMTVTLDVMPREKADA